MTPRRSRRDLARELEALVDDVGSESDTARAVVWSDPETGEWFDTPERAGEPLEKADVDPGVVWSDETVSTPWSPGEVEA